MVEVLAGNSKCVVKRDERERTWVQKQKGCGHSISLNLKGKRKRKRKSQMTWRRAAAIMVEPILMT
jgi:hypothetical protein